MRARVEKLDSNDKPTRAFQRAEKHRATKHAIKQLVTTRGLVSSQKEVAAECTRFVSIELHTAEPVDDECMNSFLVGVPMLEPDEVEGIPVRR